MGSTIIEQDYPYEILHRGQRDQSRHNKRVDEAARKQLKDIISQQDIITSEGNRKVKVRLKYLDQYRFIHNKDRYDQVGRDQFDELEEGEVIERPDPSEGGGSIRAGDAAGEEIYEAEYTVEELTDMMIKELQLPDLDETRKNMIVSDILEWTDRRPYTGIQALLDKRKTLYESIKRRQKLGDGAPLITNDDLRYRTWNIEQQKHSNAVIFLMMDRSGSMWEDKIYTCKAFFFWVVQFLKRKYEKVEIRFIAHDAVARELPEKDFFTISDAGGTRVLSAYKMCHDMIKHSYPSEIWNIYCFHASDGDTWGDEEVQCMDLVREIVKLGAALFAYVEIDMDNYRKGEHSNLLRHFEGVITETDEVIASVLQSPEDILDALQKFLRHSLRHQWSGK